MEIDRAFAHFDLSVTDLGELFTAQHAVRLGGEGLQKAKISAAQHDHAQVVMIVGALLAMRMADKRGYWLVL